MAGFGSVHNDTQRLACSRAGHHTTIATVQQLATNLQGLFLCRARLGFRLGQQRTSECTYVRASTQTKSTVNPQHTRIFPSSRIRLYAVRVASLKGTIAKISLKRSSRIWKPLLAVFRAQLRIYVDEVIMIADA